MFNSIRTTTRLLNDTTAITRVKRATAVALAGILTSTAPALAINDNALPTGGTVASGGASFDYSSNQLNVNQSTDRVVIDWNSFNIGAAAGTQFYQPGSTSVAVNRVNDVSPSAILGSLRANGKIVILNQNGVFFGQNAHVDVSGLLVSTGKIDADSFMNDGSIKLTGINAIPGAKIENQGNISIQNAGLAAFVAPNVVNSGIIEANLGKIALASGADKATVDLYGDGLVEMQLDAAASKALINNDGTLKADGGVIAITAKAASNVVDSVINMGGIVEANTVGTRNGKIVLGGSGTVNVTGKLNAKGGNGDIAVKGNKVFVSGDINAAEGDNGQVNVIGVDSMMLTGTITVGRNAFVETSADKLGIRGGVFLGEGSKWLLDPTDLRVVAGNGDGSDFNPDDSANDSEYWVGVNYINAALDVGGSTVTLTTSGNGTREGNITIDAAIIKNFGADSTLELNAHNDIFINQAITSNTNKLNVNLNGDFDLSGGDADVYIRNNINTNGGALNVNTADDIDIVNGAVINTLNGNVLLNSRNTGDGSWLWMPGAGNGTGTINSGTGSITANVATLTIKGGSSINSTGGIIAINNTGVADVDADTITNSTGGTISLRQNVGGIIQNAVNAIKNLGTGLNTLTVGAGTFNEIVTLGKDNFLLKGANFGKAGNDVTRTAETIIQGGVDYSMFVSGDDVTVDGVTVLGAVAGYRDAIWTQGADDLALRNNVLTNGDFGVYSYSSGGAATDGVIEKNAISNMTGHGVYISENQYYNVLNNVLTGVDVGITTENFYSASPTGARTLIDGNTISASAIGIRNNLSYGTQSGFKISNNTITAEDTLETRRWTGIDVISQMGGVGTLFENNDIDGSGVNATRQTDGFELTNMTGADRAVIDGGDIKNVDVGVWATDGSFYTGPVSDLLIKNVAFSNINEAGILVEDTEDALNQLPTVNASGTKVSIGTGNTFTNATQELAIAGDNVTVALEGGFAGFTKTLVKGAGPAHYVGNPYGTTTNLTTNNASINQGIGLTVSGGTVSIGAGTFDETVQAIGKSNLNIVGSGQGVTIVKPTTLGAATPLANGSPWAFQTYTPLFLIKDSTNVGVSGLTLDGSSVGGNVFGNNLSGLTYYNASGTAENVTIKDTGAFGFYAVADATKGHVARIVTAKNIISSGNWWAALAAIGNNLTMKVNGGSYDGTGGSDGLDLSFGSQGEVKNAVVKTGTHSDQAGISFHGGHDWLIDNVTITGSGTSATGIADDGPTYSVASASNITITGGSITNVGTGVDAVGGTNWDVDGTIISGASNAVGAGVSYANLTGSNSSVKNAKINNFKNGILISDTAGTTVQSNVVRNIGGDGIVIFKSGKSLIEGNFIGFTDNTHTAHAGLNNIKGDGIFISESDGDAGTKTVVKKNYITQTDGNGIFDKGSSIQVVNSDYVTIGGTAALDGNIMTTSGWDYIRLDSDVGTISNILVQFNNGTGQAERVGLYAENLTNSTIKDNVFNDSTRYGGIYTYGGSNFTLDTNTINGSDETGILVKNAGGIVTIKNNIVDNTGKAIKPSDGENSGDGIRVISSNGTADGIDSGSAFDSGVIVSGNKIGQSAYAGPDNIKGNGITVIDSSYAVVDTNTIKQATGNGIFIDPSNVAQLYDNVILGVGGHGIWSLSNDDANIYRNIITNVGLDGIYVQGGNNVTIGGANLTFANVITNAGDDGIDVNGTTGNVKVNYNKIDTTVDNGIVVNGINGASEIIGNEIKNIGWDGIQLTNGVVGGFATIKANKITNVTGASGIAVMYHNGDALLDANIIDGTDRLGIYVWNSNGLEIKANDIQNTGREAGWFGSGIHLEAANNTTVDGNLIRKTGRSAVYVGGGNAPLVTTTGNVIKNNVIGYNQLAMTSSAGDNNVKDHGIFVASSNSADILSNKMSGVVQDGIHVENSGDLDVINNQIKAFGSTTEGADGRGIYVLNGTSALIDGNTVRGGDGTSGSTGKKGSGGNAIHVDNNDTVEIYGNTIQGGDGKSGGGNIGGSGTGGHGIYVTNSQAAKIGASGKANKILAGSNNGNILFGFRNGGMGADKSGIYAEINPGSSSSQPLKDGIYIGYNKIDGNSRVDAVGDDGIYVINSANNTSGTDGARALIEWNEIGDVGDTSSDDGIDVRNTNRVDIKNNKVDQVAGNGVRLADSDNALIESNTVWNTGNDGDAVVDGDGIHVFSSDDVDVKYNTVHTIARHGIYADASNSLYIYDNTIGTGGFEYGAKVDGIHVNGGRNAEIDLNDILGGRGLVLLGAGNDGIHVVNNREAIISNNLIQGGPTTTFIITIPGGAGAGHDGIYVDNSGAIIGGGLDAIFGQLRNGVQIFGNRILNDDLALGALHDGIHVINSASGLLGDRALVEDNTVRGVGHDGIFLTSTNGAIINHNTISLAGDDGIDVSGSSLVEITDNTISAVLANGIILNGGALQLIKHNTITGTGNDGINVFGVTGLSVDDNTTTLTGVDGIDVRNVTGGEIINNHVYAALTGHGIFVDPSFLIDISNNVVAGTALDGIHADDVIGLTITNNFVTLTGDDGIDVRNSAGVVIAGNTTFLTTGDGIQAWGTLGLGILGNNVFLAGDDGIDVDGTVLAAIAGNTVVGAINNGIEVSNGLGVLVAGNDVALVGRDGIALNRTVGSIVAGNTVALVGHDGISLSDSALSLIAGNTVVGALHDGISLDGTIATLVAGNNVFLVGHDGISVEDSALSVIAANVVVGALHDGISLDNTIGTVVAANAVALVGHDGIAVEDSALSVIAGNIVIGALHDGISLDDTIGTVVALNTVAFVGNDGISVDDSALSLIVANDIAFAAGDGIDIDDSSYVAAIANNVDFVLGNGMEVSDSNNILLAGNDIGQFGFVGGNGVDIRDSNDIAIVSNNIYSNVQGNGVFIDPSFNVSLVNNVIDNVGGIGIYVQGLGNGLITLAGNTVNSLPGNVGARFESGEIDMTGATNTFNGGLNGLEFDGPEVKLTGDTIGTTAFTGQSQYYVQLSNGALFNPGTPTLIDGYSATFEGLTASAMTPLEYQNLTDKIFDFNDQNTLGLFFPLLSSLDENELLPDQKLNQIAKRFGGSVTIVGLPLANLPASGTGVFSNLANIAPAAGGDVPGEQASALDLNAIDSAAGSETVNTWDSVYSHLGGNAGPVTYNLEVSPQAAIASGI